MPLKKSSARRVAQAGSSSSVATHGCAVLALCSPGDFSPRQCLARFQLNVFDVELNFPEATMSNQSRRTFVKSTAAATACTALAAFPFTARANPLGLPIGCQTWPVRQMIAKDFPGTIKTLAAAGFQSIELCSPVGYPDSGFAGLAKYKAAELRRILSDAGVSCVSSHFSMDGLSKNQDDRIAWAKDVGMT